MPMLGPALTEYIKAKVVAKNPDFAAKIGDDMDWLFEAIGEGVVEYVQANAQVAVVSVSGVTTGGAASGPGTGTIL